MLRITQRFKAKPTLYYAMSIVASWAGVGSLMNFRTLALENGAVPAIIWAVFNSLACIVFGVLVSVLPGIRRIMRTKPMMYFIAFVTIFQVWTQQSGLREIFADTPIGETGGTIIAYASCIIFALILLKNGMIRNVLSDDLSWIIVYGMLAVTVIGSLLYTRGQFNHVSAGLEAKNIGNGIYKGLLLIPGPFTNPYYYKIFDYNDGNPDGIQPGNLRRAFTLAGIMFGVYMAFAAVLTWVKFSPALNIVKAILISVIAISSISTYLYSAIIVFGRIGGTIVNALTIGSWQFLMPLGVMGIWTLMSEIRGPVIALVIIAAVIMSIRSRRKGELA